MVAPKINWKDVRSRLIWGIILSIPLGTAGSLLANSISKQTPQLSIDLNSFLKAGETIIDMDIKNTGDFDLCGLAAHLKFEKPPEIRVEPDRWKAFISLSGTEFHLLTKPDYEFKKDEVVELRFVSAGSNRIINYNSIPEDVNAICIRRESVNASFNKDFGFAGFDMKGVIIIGLSIFVFFSIMAILFCLVLLLRRSTNKGTPESK